MRALILTRRRIGPVGEVLGAGSSMKMTEYTQAPRFIDECRAGLEALLEQGSASRGWDSPQRPPQQPGA